jgi:hypothetical protein
VIINKFVTIKQNNNELPRGCSILKELLAMATNSAKKKTTKKYILENRSGFAIWRALDQIKSNH